MSKTARTHKADDSRHERANLPVPAAMPSAVGAPGEPASPMADSGLVEPLTDEELMRCHDAMKGVYLERKSNLRAARLLRKAIRHVKMVRRPVIPVDMLREGRGLLVFGPSRAGKSSLVQRLLAGVPDLREAGEGQGKPLVSLQVKGPATLATVGIQILQAVGYPVEKNLDEKEAWQLVYRHLRQAGTLVLHLGEMQNVSGTANAPERLKLRNTIRSLLINELHPMVVIMSGLPEIHDFVKADVQIASRSPHVAIETLRPDQVEFIAKGVRSIAEAVNLGVDETELVSDIAPRLLHFAGYQLGRAMEFVVLAAEQALAPDDDDGERLPSDLTLCLRHFADVYELQTGSDEANNPFAAENWEVVGTDAAGPTFDMPDDVEAPPPSTSSPRKGKTR